MRETGPIRFQGTQDYVATDDLRVAVNAALTLRRPLLVRGETGAGKTVLAHEIDKADIEFPNDLLDELDRMEFHVYETGEIVKAAVRPIVVITSNNEKDLPDAFLHRCFFPLHPVSRSRHDAENPRGSFSADPDDAGESGDGYLL